MVPESEFPAAIQSLALDACLDWAKGDAFGQEQSEAGSQIGVKLVLGTSSESCSTSASSSAAGSSSSSSVCSEAPTTISASCSSAALSALASAASTSSSDARPFDSASSLAGLARRPHAAGACAAQQQQEHQQEHQQPAGASVFVQREAHQCTTSDGWRLHILHVYDPVAEASNWPARQHPVLMVPGLASSGEHTFDLLPDHSLVNALVARGYDVWVADLRGNGRSQKPRLLDSRTWWTVDDHFLRDVPAVLEHVLAATGAKQVHWIGHSMGGMLAVGLQSQQHRLAGALRSITMLASGCFGAGSWHSLLKPVVSVLTRFGFPAGLIAGAIGALSGTAAALLPLEALFYWPCNMPAAAGRKLLRSCFHFIPVGVIRQFMGSLNSATGLAAADGSFLYANPQALALARVPVQALSGSWDLFCPPAGAARTVGLFGSADKRFVCLGPGNGTARRHYGHFDIVCGKEAGAEVYPYVAEWLERHDAPITGKHARAHAHAARPCC